MKLTNCVKWALVLMVLGMVGAWAQDAVSLATPTAMARVAKKVAPQYPAAARQLNVTGEQEVAITVGPQGDVEEAKVLKGNAMFSQSSLAAVKQWKFTPLTKDGAAAKFTTVIVFNYQK